MLAKFLEGLGGKLAERWVTTMLTPAFIFWAGGMALWIRDSESVKVSELFKWFADQPPIAQVLLLVAGLLGVTMSSVIVQRFDVISLRFLEGYWPSFLKPLKRLLTRWQSFWLRRAECKVQELAAKGLSDLTSEERQKYAALDWKLMHAPASPKQYMPTKLGNILRAAELRPRDKYGLDAVVCWSRLWLFLPDSIRKEITEARAVLDADVRVWVWSVLFVIWTIWSWWAAPIGLLAALLVYRWFLLSAAEVYGELVEAVFDLHRTTLYKSMRWPLPVNPAEERRAGEELTAYLWRGSDQPTPSFTPFEE